MTKRKRADVLLVERGLFESRTRAQAAIAAGLVTADGVKLKKASDEIADSAELQASPEHPWVSRGGMKLAAALFMFTLPALLEAADPKPKSPADPEGEIVTLDTFKVTGSAVSNFSVSIRVLWSKTPKKTRIVITQVLSHSDAEKLGLQVGDEIVRIDNLVVADADRAVTR